MLRSIGVIILTVALFSTSWMVGCTRKARKSKASDVSSQSDAPKLTFIGASSYDYVVVGVRLAPMRDGETVSVALRASSTQQDMYELRLLKEAKAIQAELWLRQTGKRAELLQTALVTREAEEIEFSEEQQIVRLRLGERAWIEQKNQTLLNAGRVGYAGPAWAAQAVRIVAPVAAVEVAPSPADAALTPGVEAAPRATEGTAPAAVGSQAPRPLPPKAPAADVAARNPQAPPAASKPPPPPEVPKIEVKTVTCAEAPPEIARLAGCKR